MSHSKSRKLDGLGGRLSYPDHRLMNDEQTPINARPQRRSEESFEDLSLALREHLLWPVQDYLLGLSDRGRLVVAGGAAVLALGLGIAGYSLASSGGSQSPGATEVATVVKRTPPAPAAPKPKPTPTLHGAAPV